MSDQNSMILDMIPRRVAAVWWLMGWRIGLGMVVLFMASNIVVAFAALGALAAPSGLSHASGAVIHLVWGGFLLFGAAAIVFFVTEAALRKRYGDFRLLLLRREPGGGAMPDPQAAPLELSRRHVLSVAWLILWRGAALTALALLIFNFGIIQLAGGGSASNAGAATTVGALFSALFLLPLSLGVLFLVTKMALRKPYREFTLALVPLQLPMQ